MNAHLAQAVRNRAANACEYCRMPQAGFPTIKFHVDHIVARQHGGKTVMGNLALACHNCNAFKGPNLAGIDSPTGRLTRLYNPRRHRWGRHFRWDGPRIVARTAVGRATVQVLNLNDAEVVLTRATLILEGLLVPEIG
ncbi:MAG TPA: HNH endonuclease signature motif containing protein [Gemmataceae bacterium]|nr:HNH endonuclease signature motif containing protein [Gemmataceae bacterium]